MKCMILAAGYATRLYPITENFPKPLLTVGCKTILDWLIDDISENKKVEEFIVISNHKYFDNFKEWAKNKEGNITIIDDGSTTNDKRLGAVKDIEFGTEKCGFDDMLIIAGDNVLDFSLNSFIEFAESIGKSAVMRYFEPEHNKLRKSGVLEIDEFGKVISMEEKPNEPKSNWCCPPFYFYKKEDIKLIKEAINGGCSVDAPGSFVSWLCEKSDIYSMEMPGKRYDVGDIKSYENIKKTYKGIC